MNKSAKRAQKGAGFGVRSFETHYSKERKSAALFTRPKEREKSAALRSILLFTNYSALKTRRVET
jgi:hypothetical protein